MRYSNWHYTRDTKNKNCFVIVGANNLEFRVPNEELARFLCEAPNMYELLSGMRNLEILRHYIRDDRKGGGLLQDIHDLLSRVEGRF